MHCIVCTTSMLHLTNHIIVNCMHNGFKQIFFIFCLQIMRTHTHWNLWIFFLIWCQRRDVLFLRIIFSSTFNRKSTRLIAKYKFQIFCNFHSNSCVMLTCTHYLLHIQKYECAVFCIFTKSDKNDKISKFSMYIYFKFNEFDILNKINLRSMFNCCFAWNAISFRWVYFKL